MFIRFLGFLIFMLVACSPASGPADASGEPPETHDIDLLIENVRIVDVSGGKTSEPRFLYVVGQSIHAISDEIRSDLIPAQTIDAEGQFLIPGLIDMHHHLLVPRCETPESYEGVYFDRPLSERMLSTALDYGVTTIRSPANPTIEGLALRDDLNAGRVCGPRVRASAELISNGRWDEDQLRSYVRDALPYEPDYFKAYAGLSADQIAIVIDEAHAAGVEVIGHLQRTGWKEATELGIDHITHGASWSPDMLTPEAQVEYRERRAETRGFVHRLEWLDLLELQSAPVQETLQTMAEAGISLDPTLVAYDARFSDPDTDSVYRSSPLAEVFPELVSDWQMCGSGTGNWTNEDYQRWQSVRLQLLGLTREMYEAGVLLTTGTDVTNPWVFPGEALHREFELLAEAGLTPADILKMATLNGAQALRLEDAGQVVTGYRADLVLLGSNPLENITNTQDIVWVMQDGDIVKDYRQN